MNNRSNGKSRIAWLYDHQTFMRPLLMPFAAALIMAAQSQAMEWNVFTTGPNPDSASNSVSFSIGYPKGWLVNRIPSPHQSDFYSGPVLSAGSEIWSFAGASSTNSQYLRVVTICRSVEATAAEAAESFSDNLPVPARPALRAVKTAAGDSGWMVERKEDSVFHPAWMVRDDIPLSTQIQEGQPAQEITLVHQAFFFRSKSPGIRAGLLIEITTNAADSAGRAELDQLVLQTLQFGSH